MAPEENNEIREPLQENAESPDESNEKSGGKNSSKLIMIIGGATVSLALTVFLAYYLATAFIIPSYYGDSAALVDSTGAIIQTQQPVPVQVVKSKPVKAKDSSDGDELEEDGDKDINLKLEHFVLNPYGSNGRRFMTMDLAFVTTSKDMEKELHQKEPQIRDEINNLMSRKTIAELTNVVSKKKIKRDINLILNRILTTGKIKEVYFTKYVLQ